MMRTHTHQSGFSAIEIVLVVAVVALIGFLGYTAYTHFQANKTDGVGQQAPTANDVTSAPAINSTSDLDAAQAALDQTDPSNGNTDATQLDNAVSAF
jgi:prepilin-type N-terminal cleavage/methylation domain-containing protein